MADYLAEHCTVGLGTELNAEQTQASFLRNPGTLMCNLDSLGLSSCLHNPRVEIYPPAGTEEMMFKERLAQSMTQSPSCTHMCGWQCEPKA